MQKSSFPERRWDLLHPEKAERAVGWLPTIAQQFMKSWSIVLTYSATMFASLDESLSKRVTWIREWMRKQHIGRCSRCFSFVGYISCHQAHSASSDHINAKSVHTRTISQPARRAQGSSWISAEKRPRLTACQQTRFDLSRPGNRLLAQQTDSSTHAG